MRRAACSWSQPRETRPRRFDAMLAPHVPGFEAWLSFITRRFCVSAAESRRAGITGFALPNDSGAPAQFLSKGASPPPYPLSCCGRFWPASRPHCWPAGSRLPRGQSCPCQKQPWTKSASLRAGKTRSGEPGRALRCSRYRRPIAWTTRRTFISGRGIARFDGAHDGRPLFGSKDVGQFASPLSVASRGAGVRFAPT